MILNRVGVAIAIAHQRKKVVPHGSGLVRFHCLASLQTAIPSDDRSGFALPHMDSPNKLACLAINFSANDP